MTIDVFVLQIMISGEIQAVNIGNTRLVPGFPQGSNSLEKASALGTLGCALVGLRGRRERAGRRTGGAGGGRAGRE